MINIGPNQNPSVIQDPVSHYLSGINGELYTPDSFKAWCAPTAAACQLGHLQLNTPPEINDNFISDEKPIALSTIDWDTNKGWGDYLLDGPNNRIQISDTSYQGLPTDFGFYMNTNNVGINGSSANSQI